MQHCDNSQDESSLPTEVIRCILRWPGEGFYRRFLALGCRMGDRVAADRQSPVVPAQEPGRLITTIFTLRYLESEDYRRRILTQLNEGEAMNGLREFLLFANKGTLRKKQEKELRNQAGCWNLVTNVVVTRSKGYPRSRRTLAIGSGGPGHPRCFARISSVAVSQDGWRYLLRAMIIHPALGQAASPRLKMAARVSGSVALSDVGASTVACARY
jgi:Tn3 transposase DDE domain